MPSIFSVMTFFDCRLFKMGTFLPVHCLCLTSPSLLFTLIYDRDNDSCHVTICMCVSVCERASMHAGVGFRASVCLSHLPGGTQGHEGATAAVLFPSLGPLGEREGLMGFADVCWRHTHSHTLTESLQNFQCMTIDSMTWKKNLSPQCDA